MSDAAAEGKLLRALVRAMRAAVQGPNLEAVAKISGLRADEFRAALDRLAARRLVRLSAEEPGDVRLTPEGYEVVLQAGLMD